MIGLSISKKDTEVVRIINNNRSGHGGQGAWLGCFWWAGSPGANSLVELVSRFIIGLKDWARPPYNFDSPDGKDTWRTS